METVIVVCLVLLTLCLLVIGIFFGILLWQVIGVVKVLRVRINELISEFAKIGDLVQKIEQLVGILSGISKSTGTAGFSVNLFKYLRWFSVTLHTFQTVRGIVSNFTAHKHQREK